jgi:hypothetical protein
MNPPTAEKLQELLSQGRPEHAVVLLQRLDPDVAADLVMSIPYEEQQILFRALPVDFAATLVGHFPYYHSYVLLHSRPAEELALAMTSTPEGSARCVQYPTAGWPGPKFMTPLSNIRRGRSGWEFALSPRTDNTSRFLRP